MGSHKLLFTNVCHKLFPLIFYQNISIPPYVLSIPIPTNISSCVSVRHHLSPFLSMMHYLFIYKTESITSCVSIKHRLNLFASIKHHPSHNGHGINGVKQGQIIIIL